MTADRSGTLLVDAGFFVALLNRRDQYHGWAEETLRGIPASSTTFVTCEAVLAEAFYLVEQRGGNRNHLMDLLRRLRMDVQPAWNARAEHVMAQYDQADFADACLIALYETLADAAVLTVDRDFFTYRDSSAQPLRVLHPDTHPA